MRDAALSMKNVTFAYPRQAPILRDVRLDAHAGEVTAILGPNGSGKTTLLRLAAGLAHPHEGSVTLNATAQSATDASREGRIGYIPQQLGLVRNATALDNALLGGARELRGLRGILRLAPATLRDRALAALEDVGLREKADVAVKKLSGGERQRVAIARTLVQRPTLIVADELISSLDALQASAIMEIAATLRKQRVALLISLHQLEIALTHADQIVFLARGSAAPPRPAHAVTPEEARCALAA